jgi:hypothetical protein
VICASFEPTLRGRDDNRPALGDMRHSRPGQVERPVDVGLDRSVKLLVGNVGDIGDRVHDTGVVDENVDPTPRLHDGLDDALAPGLVADVLGVQEALSACRRDERFRLVGVDLLFGQVDDGDLGSGVCYWGLGGTAEGSSHFSSECSIGSLDDTLT